MSLGKTVFQRAAEGIKDVRAVRDAIANRRKAPVANAPVADEPAIPQWAYIGAGVVIAAVAIYFISRK